MGRMSPSEYKKYWEINKNVLLPFACFLFLASLLILPQQVKELRAYLDGTRVLVVVQKIEIEKGHVSPHGLSSSLPSSEIHFSYIDNNYTLYDKIKLDTSSYKNVKAGDTITLIKSGDIFTSPSILENLLGVIMALFVLAISAAAFYYHFFVYKRPLKKKG